MPTGGPQRAALEAGGIIDKIGAMASAARCGKKLRRNAKDKHRQRFGSASQITPPASCCIAAGCPGFCLNSSERDS
jgi:hypothetical protein